MAKGDGMKYIIEMRNKTEIILKEAFIKNPKEPPFPSKGMSWQEILDEAIRRENER